MGTTGIVGIYGETGTSGTVILEGFYGTTGIIGTTGFEGISISGTVALGTIKV